MNTFKKKTWKWALALAGGMAVVAASGALDDPAPDAAGQTATLNGYPAIPPSFSIADMFKAPH